jgi:GT2 family glycosyltransferase
MDASTPHVTILLLNYCGTDYTLACLQSLKHLAYNNVRIIVIDNGSPEGSAERLKMLQQQPEWANTFELLLSENNLGFSGGNNLGIRLALEQGSDAVWLLNNDTTVDPMALTELVALAQKTGGLVGSLIVYPDGRYQQAGGRVSFYTGSVKGFKEDALTDGMLVDVLTGASIYMPRAVLEQLGEWDERYFLYFEDTEFCLRAAKAGIPRNISLHSKVFHVESATTGKKNPRTQYYFHRNRLVAFLSYTSWLQALCILWYTTFRFIRTVLKVAVKTTWGLLNSRCRDQSQDLRASLRIQWLAISDALKGVRGICPHTF